MVEILKSLKEVCDFSPIKAMRDSFSKKHTYEIVADVIANPSSAETDKLDINTVTS